MRSLVLAVSVALTVTAVPGPLRADMRAGVGRVGPTYPYHRGSFETAGYGYERGYREGAKDGYHDGERGHRFELYREGDYRDADKGYKGWMGPRHEYARGYQGGYAQGYRRAYDQGRRRGFDHRRHGYDRDYRYDDDVIHEQPRWRW